MKRIVLMLVAVAGIVSGLWACDMSETDDARVVGNGVIESISNDSDPIWVISLDNGARYVFKQDDFAFAPVILDGFTKVVLFAKPLHFLAVIKGKAYRLELIK